MLLSSKTKCLVFTQGTIQDLGQEALALPGRDHQSVERWDPRRLEQVYCVDPPVPATSSRNCVLRCRLDRRVPIPQTITPASGGARKRVRSASRLRHPYSTDEFTATSPLEPAPAQRKRNTRSFKNFLKRCRGTFATRIPPSLTRFPVLCPPSCISNEDIVT